MLVAIATGSTVEWIVCRIHHHAFNQRTTHYCDLYLCTKWRCRWWTTRRTRWKSILERKVL